MTDISKGTILVAEGTVNRSIYLIRSGLLRAYRTVEDREMTMWFAGAGEAAFSSWGYVEGTPARLSIAASCDTQALHLTQEGAEKLFTATPALSVWGRKLFERLVLGTDVWFVELNKPLARERYLTLVEKMPEILQLAPLKDIAAYLSVTPQSLSRIRAEIVARE